MSSYTTGMQRDPQVAADGRGNFVVVGSSDGSTGDDSTTCSVRAQRYRANGSSLGAEFQANTYTTGDQATPSVASDVDRNLVIGVEDVPGRKWRRRLARAAIVLAAATFGIAAIANAQFLANGPQFQVNGFTTGNQAASVVCADPSGGFVVLWQSTGSRGSDISGWSVQRRHFSEHGESVSGDLQVNTFTTGSQYLSDVARDPLGGFLVVWQSQGSSGTDTSGTSVLAQRYDANGQPWGGELQVNTLTANDQKAGSLAFDGSGNALVVWMSGGVPGDGTIATIHGQGYDPSGVPLGSEFQVNAVTSNHQVYPHVAADSSGTFLVVWENRVPTWPALSTIRGRRFLADGTPLAGEFQVASYTAPSAFSPVVTADDAGVFVVAWASDGSKDGDTSLTSIQARRFHADGSALGKQFQVNSDTLGYQRGPRLAADPGGGFVVAWTGEVGYAAQEIRAQRYRSDGTKQGGEHTIADWHDGPGAPAMGMSPSGDFIVTWTSAFSSGTDTSSTSVQAQRFDGLFRDDFDAGNLSRWSTTSP